MSHQVSVSLAITDVTQFSLIPGGGTSLSSGQDFLLEDWARDIIKQQSFSSPSQWASWVLACRGYKITIRISFTRASSNFLSWEK